MTQGVLRAMVADLAPREQRATAYGIYHAATGLALLPASVLAGLLWQGVGPWSGFGPRAPFLFGAGLSLMALALFTLWARQGDRAKEGLA
jgi:predicted MFS family arabinose efflux permease